MAIRVVAMEEKNAAFIDKAASVQAQLKNLTYEDNAAKSVIVQLAKDRVTPDEKSVKLKGCHNVATVSMVTSESLDVSKLDEEQLAEAVSSGAVTQKSFRVIKADKLEELVALLGDKADEFLETKVSYAIGSGDKSMIESAIERKVTGRVAYTSIE
jgi:hypothetical protein